MILPLAAIYFYIQRYYLRTSRELKRLDSVSKSPIYAHFQESLGGITTINANRWLAVRLEFIGSFIILSAAGFAIIAVNTGSGPTAGMVGLAMSYALQITQSLNWIVRQTVEVETYVNHLVHIFSSYVPY